jgi:peptidoglycan/xylan/chitin deacetylase (PgdA/CDA1 family)
LRGFARKACADEKICGAQQKSGLKPPPLVVDSPILANFLLDKLSMNRKVVTIHEFYNCFSQHKFDGQFVITFDDVHESVYKYAYPLLKSRNIPFALFVNLSLLDTPNFITTPQLIEMAKCHLCTIGSHGINHVFYRNLKRNQCSAELESSKKNLEFLIKKPIDFFAFPYGSLVACSFRNITEAKGSNYKMAFSTIPSGVWHSPIINKYFIPRVNVSNKVIKRL